jgi:hypothetical protein
VTFPNIRVGDGSPADSSPWSVRSDGDGKEQEQAESSPSPDFSPVTVAGIQYQPPIPPCVKKPLGAPPVRGGARLKWSHEAGAFVNDAGKTIHDLDFEEARAKYVLYANSDAAKDYKTYIQDQAVFEDMCINVQRFHAKKK